MALISERSAFAWAEGLAAEQRESFPLVLVELFRAVASGDLPATMPGPLDDWSRKFLLSRAEAVRAEYAVEGKVSRIEGPAEVAHRIFIRDRDMRAWLDSRLEPAGGEAAAKPAADREQSRNTESLAGGTRTNEVAASPPQNTVSYHAVKEAITKHGPGTEGQLRAHAAQSLPGKHVPRGWLRRARDELFGKPNLGRPKSKA